MPPTAGTRLRFRAQRAQERQTGAKRKRKKTQSLKNQIRGAERALKRPGLPDDARASLEARLAALQAQASERATSERERALATRYHKIKFFDRRKIDRKIAAAQRELEAAAEGSAEASAAAARLEELRDDLVYVKFFPKGQKYLSLFPPEPLEEAAAAKRERRLAKLREEARRLAAGVPAGGSGSDAGGSGSDVGGSDDEGAAKRARAEAPPPRPKRAPPAPPAAGQPGQPARPKRAPPAPPAAPEEEEDDFFLAAGAGAGSDSGSGAELDQAEEEEEEEEEERPSKKAKKAKKEKKAKKAKKAKKNA